MDIKSQASLAGLIVQLVLRRDMLQHPVPHDEVRGGGDTHGSPGPGQIKRGCDQQMYTYFCKPFMFYLYCSIKVIHSENQS